MINIDLFPPCHQQHKQPLLVSSANQLHPSTDHAHHKLATPSKLKPRPLRFSPAHYHDAEVCVREEGRERKLRNQRKRQRYHEFINRPAEQQCHPRPREHLANLPTEKVSRY